MQSRRFKPWMRWTAFGVALVGAMVVAWHAVDTKARRELAAARAAFGVHGFPMRLEEMIPSPVPDEENADVLLREAWRIVSGLGDWENPEAAGIFIEIDRLKFAIAATSTSSVAPDKLARLRALITDPQFVAFEEAIANAVRRSHWLPAFKYTPGIEATDSSFRPVCKMIGLLATAAGGHALTTGGRDAAWRNLVVAQRLSDWIGESPILVHRIFGDYQRQATAAAMLRVLGKVGAPDDLGKLIDQLVGAANDPMPGYQRALHAQRILLLDWVAKEFVENRKDWTKEMAGRAGIPSWADWLRPWLTPVISSLGRPRFTDQLAKCYRLHLEFCLAISRGGAAMFARLDAIAEQARLSDDSMARELLVSHQHFARSLSENCARERALVGLLAAWRHHRTTGIWPATVDELNLPISVTRDPCGSEPIRLRQIGEEFVVYALGFDGDDDGGREVDPSAAGGDGDIAVRVRLSAARIE